MATAGGKNREPDWGRFGLNDERQPLNPEAGGGSDANGKGQTKDLYGGQAQNENELFAQDQVNHMAVVSKTE